MLSKSNRDRKSDALLIDADRFSDPLFSSEAHKKLEENVSEESSPDVISIVICSNNGFFLVRNVFSTNHES
ncbi:unnamed protein product [Schistosoma mattheei]|uniref:Uncharacterized protein n=1 Tax=Schistosoma mattheei TaxID=31246 RepID=A0A183PKY9_9TREM|nr:unnamed protein product [Schistosoma mattheei]